MNINTVLDGASSRLRIKKEIAAQRFVGEEWAERDEEKDQGEDAGASVCLSRAS